MPWWARAVLRAVHRLAAAVGIVGMDIVELSPPYDAGMNSTALLAHRAVLEALTGTAMRRLGITEPGYLDERAALGPSVKKIIGAKYTKQPPA